MTPRHHPSDELLMALAAGHLPAGQAVVLAAHAEGCAQCAGRVAQFEALGGAWLEAAEPELLAPDALAKTLARLDTPPRREPASRRGLKPKPELPPGIPWPASLHDRDVPPWRWMGPGMRYARVPVPEDRQGTVYLLWIAPGRSLARHTHTDLEFTQVLSGSFEDGRELFAGGDFDATDAQVLHQPVVHPGETCVCLAYVRGRLRFEGAVAGMVGRMIGM